MSEHLVNVYNRAPIAVEKGAGIWLTDVAGRTYLDCVSGIATNSLGHAHPKLIAALVEQANKLWHVSNIFRIPLQEKLAQQLSSACFAERVFFANSGAEAVECALKAARRYHFVKGQSQRIDVIGFEGSFHGRTYATINAAGNPAYVDGFGPRLPGYKQLPLDDWEALKTAISSPTTAAVIVEPVQGEGGARALPEEWLQRVRKLTREQGVLLILDEVQSGMGRTGRLFAHQWFEGVEPDLMAIAKALGGGFPVGACLATEDAASGLVPGTHGTTFGGNPLAMAVACAAFEEISQPETLQNVISATAHFNNKLNDLKIEFPDIIEEIRGKGLLIGLKLSINNREFMNIARGEGILVAGGGDNCVRLLPSLLIKTSEVDEAVFRLSSACAIARVKKVEGI